MSKEISFDYGLTGKTVYAVIISSVGQIWNGSAFEDLLTANWATYDVSLTEQSTTGIYAGDFPAVAAGVYTIGVREQTGGSPHTTDIVIGSGVMEWDGTAEIPLSTIDTNVDDVETILGTPANFMADVSALALEATLTAIKGAGWTDETLVAIKSVIDAILVDTGTTLDAKLDTIDGIVDSILVDTGTTLDGKITTIDGIVDDILVDTGTDIPASIAALDTDSVLDAIIDGVYTVKQVLQIMVGALAGKLSGGGTDTLTFRDLSDTLDRIVATVDASKNRTGVTYDV